MTKLRGAIVALLLAASSCAPPAPPPPPAPEAHHTPRLPPDWFQQQLARAGTARRTHQPAGDKDGAQAAYDGIVRAACQRVAIEGPDKYKPRCDAILKPPLSAPQDPFACETTGDDETMRTCND